MAVAVTVTGAPKMPADFGGAVGKTGTPKGKGEVISEGARDAKEMKGDVSVGGGGGAELLPPPPTLPPLPLTEEEDEAAVEDEDDDDCVNVVLPRKPPVSAEEEEEDDREEVRTDCCRC